MSSQKFIGRNRAPRVQIEYDVELYGADKKVQLPFVMGVMADLSGNSGRAPAPLPERKFLEVSADNLDDRMSALEPGVTLSVPNTLTGDGNLKVEMSFKSMDDFSPAAVAQRAGPAPIAGGAPAARQSDHVHGWQDRCRGPDCPGAKRSRIAPAPQRRRQQDRGTPQRQVE